MPFSVRTTRWEHGWELEISDAEYREVGVTCTDETCTNGLHGDCADADYMARDYLATTYDLTAAEAAAFVIEIAPA